MTTYIKPHLPLLFSIIFMSSGIFCQTQKGNDIDGEYAGDWSGYSVSMPDANTLATGAPYNDNNGVNSGNARIFSWNGSSWLTKGLSINGEAGNDQSACSVSMSDSNTIALGAYSNTGINGVLSGHARVYKWIGGIWIQKGNDIDGEASNDQSGFCLDMADSNTLAIGAFGNYGNNGVASGHVRVYSWDGNVWTQKGNDIDGKALNDLSGFSVNMPYSNTIAIGAIGNDGGGADAGHVRIYTYDGIDWIQKGLDIYGEDAGDNSGWYVCMPDTNTIAIGANSNSGNGNYAGHVRIYTWDGSLWVQKGNDIDGEFAGDQSGWSLSMPNSDIIAIGGRNNNGNGNEAGHVRIYKWDGNIWVQACLDIDGEAANDHFGYTVNMPDANTIAIGAPHNGGNGFESGHTRIYTNLGLNTNILSNNRTFYNIFPNPTNAIVNINLNETLNRIKLDVYNNLGQRLITRKYYNTSEIELNLENLERGIYFIKIQNNNKESTYHLIKE